MRAIKKAAVALAHVTVVSLTLHAWHVVTSERMLDAMADVGLDKAADLTLRAAQVEVK
jgi:hypothetical protein